MKRVVVGAAVMAGLAAVSASAADPFAGVWEGACAAGAACRIEIAEAGPKRYTLRFSAGDGEESRCEAAGKARQTGSGRLAGTLDGGAVTFTFLYSGVLKFAGKSPCGAVDGDYWERPD